MATGANHGFGLEIQRQLARDHGLHVVLTARDPAKVAAAAQALRDDGLDVASHELDITQDDSAAAWAMWTKQPYGAFDVLVNNAGIQIERIYRDAENIETDALDVEFDVVKQVLDINLLGSLRVIQHSSPLLRSGGRVENMPAQMGQLAWADGNMMGYRLSKTALNGLTANLALGLKERDLGELLLPGPGSPIWGPNTP